MPDPRLADFLKTQTDIEFIRYQWFDYCGVLRAIVVPVAQCRRLDLHSRPFKVSPNAMTVATLTGAFMQDHDHTGADYIYPDFSSLRTCHYTSSHASVMCYIFESDDNAGFERCPRTILNRVLEASKEFEPIVGFEIEFRCLNWDGSDLNDCMNAWWSTCTLRNRCGPILDDIVRILQKSGIAVEHYHAEGGIGVFEISTGPKPVLEAIDDWVYTREAIKTEFSKHNILATMHPSPAVHKHNGLGAHFHFSLTLDAKGRDEFLAGVMDRLPAFCAFAMPLEESYKRVNEFRGEAGFFVCWGTENREVPVRRVKDGHWEVRCCDASANMYLAMAVWLASGLDGLNTKKELTLKDFGGNPSKVAQPMREKFGISTELPHSLHESLSWAAKFDWTSTGLEKAVKRFVEVKRQETMDLKALTDDERRKLLIRHF